MSEAGLNNRLHLPSLSIRAFRGIESLSIPRLGRVTLIDGWDCVRGFAQAATELEDAEGVMVRLEREDDRIRVVEYPEEKLTTAARHGIEVR